MGQLFAQSPPLSSDRPWHSSSERKAVNESRRFQTPTLRIDSERVYSLTDLIDLAEAHNPETRVAWEMARAQAAVYGIARSELFPTLTAAALAGVNFGFNDVHRQIIYDLSQAYYRLLNAAGQEEAAGASLVNAQAVQHAAEERLHNGLATLPDVLEARSSTAQAQYNLQAVLGAEEIARGDLATTLGGPANARTRVQPLGEVPIPTSAPDTVEEAIHRALEQRPDLQAQALQVRAAQAERQQAQAAYYPNLSVSASPRAQSLYLQQQTFPCGHTAELTGSVAMNLTWTVFDGGARRSRVAEAEAQILGAKARVAAVRDQVEDQVWTAYSNLQTAFRQREASTALLNAATQSYSAALESYNYGVRNLLDVTNAHKVLAQARSTDIQARTQVLAALADRAFRTGDAIQTNARRIRP